MLDSTKFLKGAKISKLRWTGMLAGILLGFVPLLAQADATTDALLQAHNQERAKAGRPALCLNQQLVNAATKYCQQMLATGNFDHIGTDGSDPGSRIRAAGYNWYTYGENIAWGQTSVSMVMGDWMSSSGHRANILNGAFKEAGFAKCGPYWVADFAAPLSGKTNCISGSSTTNTTTTTTANAAAKAAGLAIYNACKKYTDGWYYNPTNGLYYIQYNNSCFKYDPYTAYMYKLVLNKSGIWAFTRVQY